MAKAKAATSPAKKPAFEREIPAEVINPDGIELTKIDLSTFDTQLRRRNRLSDDEILELANSIIEAKGLIHPVVVRPKGDRYELVSGERRYRAVQMLGAKTIAASVRELTDDEALTIQTIENLQRVDVHPLDEAFGFASLLKQGVDPREIGLRVGKTPSFIAKRASLTNLLPDLITGIEQNKVSLTEATMIAAYPEKIQKKALEKYGKDFCQARWVSVESLRDVIDQATGELKTAPFSLKSASLHKEGLTCVECPKRVGANPNLFGEVELKDDRCLDTSCYKGKVQKHFEAILDKWSTEGQKKWGSDYQAAKVFQYSNPGGWFGKGAIGSGNYDSPAKDASYFPEKSDKTKYCPSAENALKMGWGDAFPKQVKICRDKDCEIHWPKAGASASKSRSFNQSPESLNRQFWGNCLDAAAVDIITDHAGKWAAKEVKALKGLEAAVRFDTAAMLVASAVEMDIGWERIRLYFRNELEALVGFDSDRWISDVDEFALWLRERLEADQLLRLGKIAEAAFAMSYRDLDYQHIHNIAELAGRNFLTVAAGYALQTEKLTAGQKKKIEAWAQKVVNGDLVDAPALFGGKEAFAVVRERKTLAELDSRYRKQPEKPAEGEEAAA